MKNIKLLSQKTDAIGRVSMQTISRLLIDNQEYEYDETVDPMDGQLIVDCLWWVSEDGTKFNDPNYEYLKEDIRKFLNK